VFTLIGIVRYIAKHRSGPAPMPARVILLSNPVAAGERVRGQLAQIAESAYLVTSCLFYAIRFIAR